MIATDILLALHLIGLVIGAGSGFATGVVIGEAAKRSAEEAVTLRSVGPLLSKFSAGGLLVMLLTGPALVFMKYDGFDALPHWFWAKISFVVVLTVAIGAVEVTYAQIKGGNLAAESRLAILGPIAGLSSMLALIFAVLAFH